MAAKARTNTPFAFEIVSDTDAAARRTTRGLRRSKYSTIGDQVKTITGSDVLTFVASKNEVQGIRNYMRRNFADAYKVYSRRSEGDNFEVHIAKTA